jgi:hypothetical protein
LRTSRKGAVREGTVAESDDERELRKMMEDMTVESKLPAREQRLYRVDRIIVRRPRLFREAARKALAGEPLSEDEFVLTHKGFLRDEWTKELEMEWSAILLREWEIWTK